MTQNLASRAAFDETAGALVGSRVLGVSYSDVYNFGADRIWDYGGWHRAVMGVELVLDSGPASILWTNAFHPYGLEIFREPLANHLVSRDQGPETWNVEAHREWRERIDVPIAAATYFWDPIGLGPGLRLSDGAQVSEARTVDVPVALRLDFATGPGPVWFVAAVPDVSEPDKAFVHGDEIMVVFDPERLRRLGFPDEEFVGAVSAEIAHSKKAE